MNAPRWIYRTLVVLALFGMTFPQIVQAGQRGNATPTAPRMLEGGRVQLQDGGVLQGALVDANGRGVEGAPVVLVKKRQVVGKGATDAEGRFRFKDLTSGTYLVATHDGVYRYQLLQSPEPNAALLQGAIIKVDPEIARGQMFGGMTMGLIATLAIAGIVAGIIIATDNGNKKTAS